MKTSRVCQPTMPPSMTLDRNAPPHSLNSLIKSIDSGDLGLPEFQRSFIWGPTNVIDLLRTVARLWPCGTFLLQEGPQPFASKALEGAPALKARPRLLVLDGQQRLTALYHALRERSNDTYYVDMKKLAASDVLDDEHVRFLRADKYLAQYNDLEDEARAGVIRISTLTRDPEFFSWINFLSPSERSNAIRLRDEQLGGFKHYSIPCVVLESDLPLAAVAKIFETINRTGVRLDTFDLMVAKMYPFNFRLRDKLIEARDDYADTIGTFQVDGIEILKVIALHEHVRQVNAGTSPLTIRGVRESDVIALGADAVKGRWAAAVEGIHEAIEFLRDECGVVSPSLVPAGTILLALANTFTMLRKRRRTFHKDLRRWFWSTCVLQTYAQGANTQCVRDSRALLRWNDDESSPPEAVDAFVAVDDDTLNDSRRRNEMLLRAVLCSLVLDGAKDWITGKHIDASLEVHQVFPARYSRSKALEGADAVVNYTVMSPASRKTLLALSPEDLFRNTTIDPRTLKGHLVPEKSFKSAHWDDFRVQRAKMLAKNLTSLATSGELP